MVRKEFLGERIYAPHLGVRGPEAENASWSNMDVFAGDHFERANTYGVGSAFPKNLPEPVLVFDRPMPTAGELFDAYQVVFIWAVSERLRSTFDAIDPDGFDYLKAGTRFPDGSAGPSYWLADVVRTVDCYDPEQSRAINPKAMLERTVDFTFDEHVFRADMLSDAPFFRIPQSLSFLCTSSTKARIERAGHDHIFFFEVGWAR
ncbi:MAG: DUF1629 domain-containing protein [Hyphomonadaceae bacterium]|nr:DUF1629 domain-containing protein [Hyphomonadaceae bacterium]